MKEKIKEEFAREFQAAIGAEAAKVALSAMEQTPSAAIRLNEGKRPELTPGWVAESREVPWCAQGRILGQRPEFALDPNWHAGAYYVQEPASMVFSTIMKHLLELRDTSDPGMILDLCAAPGGKTTAVLNAIRGHGNWITVANELNSTRAGALRENMEKWGASNVIITNGTTREVCSVGEVFDVVIVDAPCSGEGMMRKEEAARSQWSPGLVTHCADLQRTILSDAVEALRPGGFLIYSTCTFNIAENEGNIRWLNDNYRLEPVAMNLVGTGGIRGAAPGYEDLPMTRFIPGYTDSEGLSVCVLHKPYTPHRIRLKGSAIKPLSVRLGWLMDNPDLYEANGTVHALDRRAWPLMDALRKRCKVMAGGTPMATVLSKGNKRLYEPTHALALSQSLNRDAFHLLTLDESQALGYLRRETSCLPLEGPRGFQIPTYGSLPLGLVKNIGNRVNNLYPTGLRLRKQ